MVGLGDAMNRNGALPCSSSPLATFTSTQLLRSLCSIGTQPSLVPDPDTHTFYLSINMWTSRVFCFILLAGGLVIALPLNPQTFQDENVQPIPIVPPTQPPPRNPRPVLGGPTTPTPNPPSPASPPSTWILPFGRMSQHGVQEWIPIPSDRMPF